MVRVNGHRRAKGAIQISGLSKYNKGIPPFFTMEIDLETIVPREKIRRR